VLAVPNQLASFESRQAAHNNHWTLRAQPSETQLRVKYNDSTRRSVDTCLISHLHRSEKTPSRYLPQTNKLLRDHVKVKASQPKPQQGRPKQVLLRNKFWRPQQ
jgi:hypothetical protein